MTLQVWAESGPGEQTDHQRVKSLHGKTAGPVQTVFWSNLVNQLVTAEERTPFSFLLLVLCYCQFHFPLMWFLEAKLIETIQKRVLLSFSCAS